MLIIKIFNDENYEAPCASNLHISRGAILGGANGDSNRKVYGRKKGI